MTNIPKMQCKIKVAPRCYKNFPSPNFYEPNRVGQLEQQQTSNRRGKPWVKGHNFLNLATFLQSKGQTLKIINRHLCGNQQPSNAERQQQFITKMVVVLGLYQNNNCISKNRLFLINREFMDYTSSHLQSEATKIVTVLPLWRFWQGPSWNHQDDADVKWCQSAILNEKCAYDRRTARYIDRLSSR